MPATDFSPLRIDIYATSGRSAEAAARAAAGCLREVLRKQGQARIMVGTGNSQLETIRSLARQPGINWAQIDAFHLDEYVGLAATHSSSFRHWIKHNFVDQVRPRSISYIEGDAPDLTAMIQEYGRLLVAGPIDLAFVGIGENGHIAFNDPHVANFDDPEIIKRVALDEACRRQQVGEGHFPDLNSVPQEAITVTCSGLFRVARWICSVPDRRKAQAIRSSLEGPLSTKCPGSLVRKHPCARLYLDLESASLLSPAYLTANCRMHGPNTLASATG